MELNCHELTDVGAGYIRVQTTERAREMFFERYGPNGNIFASEVAITYQYNNRRERSYLQSVIFVRHITAINAVGKYSSSVHMDDGTYVYLALPYADVQASIIEAERRKSEMEYQQYVLRGRATGAQMMQTASKVLAGADPATSEDTAERTGEGKEGGETEASATPEAGGKSWFTKLVPSWGGSGAAPSSPTASAEATSSSANDLTVTAVDEETKEEGASQPETEEKQQPESDEKDQSSPDGTKEEKKEDGEAEQAQAGGGSDGAAEEGGKAKDKGKGADDGQAE
eukprot:TRINITY_DN4292_c0_g1_i1.p1 TRINITY_DN4292_c0_g1~~TRINITY_DN4292_c0_g1_i1.p1  ORF type:complete len:285 (-),score=48.84 TRINITY_DN4292_c0_g1_i1:993-1847(-)